MWGSRTGVDFGRDKAHPMGEVQHSGVDRVREVQQAHVEVPFEVRVEVLRHGHQRLGAVAGDRDDVSRPRHACRPAGLGGSLLDDGRCAGAAAAETVDSRADGGGAGSDRSERQRKLNPGERTARVDDA